MSVPAIVLDPFVRGIAAGVLAAMSIAVWRSSVSVRVRAVTLALGLSVICWLITESSLLWAGFGGSSILVVLSYPVGGIFWLFILTLFEDRPMPWSTLAPPGALLLLGTVMNMPGISHPVLFWGLFNGMAGLLALHAGYIVARGWRGDLIESRRRARALLLGLLTLFVVGQVVVAFIARVNAWPAWRSFMISGPIGQTVLAVLILAAAALFLQARPALFEAMRRAEPTNDARAEAADRQLLSKLDAFSAGEGWRREGLAIGNLAAELGVPEHRLRRLINQRLGHRNFADFINSHRIEAAKRRLRDPAEARTTVAVVAFDLGYGSLGPFNRAFRAATGVTPTEWRRQSI